MDKWKWEVYANAVSNNLCLSVQVDGDDETVQTQYFGEDEDKNHTDEETRLLGGTSDTSVAHDADGEAGG